MRFVHRINILRALLILLVGTMLVVGWFSSKRLIASSSAAFTDGIELSQMIGLAMQSQVSFQRQLQEWKNLLLRGHSMALRKKSYGQFEKYEAETIRNLEKLKNEMRSQGYARHVHNVNDILVAHQQMGAEFRDVLEAYPPDNSINQRAVDNLVRGLDPVISKRLEDLVRALEKDITTTFAQGREFMWEKIRTRLLVFALFTLFALLGLVIYVGRIDKQLLKTLGTEPEETVFVAEKMAEGDFSERLGAAENGSLLHFFKQLQVKLTEVTMRLERQTDQLENQAATLTEREEREMVRASALKLRQSLTEIKVAKKK